MEHLAAASLASPETTLFPVSMVTLAVIMITNNGPRHVVCLCWHNAVHPAGHFQGLFPFPSIYSLVAQVSQQHHSHHHHKATAYNAGQCVNI